ncbi:sugar phosphate isomerase/epimerase [Sphingobium sp. OAS761]|uniref:sugar phosphate isomerase/epimerase family protein n=1 Tax=Sphingobium sp. OAS761 TaxID=2817901 RepID=UPI00209F0BBA|nr:sugar phosphate isomerase/epimerase [Sphingobium sp. OAS761]MCP1472432.1 sugar phosphate isomerase/epimerase [Sphingobium sp. OAS761]
MSISRPVGIDHLTVNGMPPLAFAALARDAGCESISLFAERLDINPFGFPAWSLVDDAVLRRDTLRALDDLGIGLALGEGCAIRPGVDVQHCQPVIDAFAELGARRLNLLSFEPDPNRDCDQTERFAELARIAGLDICLEFSARPGRPALPGVIARIERMGSPNLSVLVDAMHFFAAGQQVEDLGAIAPHHFTYLQLCDIRLDRVEDYMEAALHERLMPGEGVLPLPALIAALPPDIIVSMEIPQVARTLEGMPHIDRLREAARRCRAVMAQATGHT